MFFFGKSTTAKLYKTLRLWPQVNKNEFDAQIIEEDCKEFFNFSVKKQIFTLRNSWERAEGYAETQHPH